LILFLSRELLVNMNNETVLKPIKDERGWFFCQVCGQMVGDDNYCKNCGQRLKDGSWKKVRSPFERELKK